MRAINQSNIDEWLFDYFEGNLAKSEQELLVSFLNKNPALKADYESWKGSYLKEPEMIYPKANTLLKESNGGWWKKAAIISTLMLIGFSAFLIYSLDEPVPSINAADTTNVLSKINTNSSTPKQKEKTALATIELTSKNEIPSSASPEKKLNSSGKELKPRASTQLVNKKTKYDEARVAYEIPTAHALVEKTSLEKKTENIQMPTLTDPKTADEKTTQAVPEKNIEDSTNTKSDEIVAKDSLTEPPILKQQKQETIINNDTVKPGDPPKKPKAWREFKVVRLRNTGL